MLYRALQGLLGFIDGDLSDRGDHPSTYNLFGKGFKLAIVRRLLQVAIVLHAAATLQFESRDKLFRELLQFPGCKYLDPESM